MIMATVIAVLLVTGALFFFIAALGALRFPDLYTRMHAATKASAFATVLMLAGVAFYHRDAWVTVEALLIVIFIFLTAPIAAHAIGRAAHALRTPMTEETVMDDLADDQRE
ncbi:MAG: monovalent cation/H(+) antiporter subunit G [Bacteroidota bacterium]|jgi:multicomponent Na+:H+ antiporter subunit G|nr:monovalent cation/H(+) antiporter subunit G [Bacteroidota bacterium]